MPIIGIERIIYCVDDLDLCVRFFEDYGLSLYEHSEREACFELPDNARVVVRRMAHDPVPGSAIEGAGVHEIIWGVDTAEHLERLVAGLSTDREVRRDEQGIHHFIADGGVPMGLRHWPEKRHIRTSTDPLNSPGNINRMNVHRKWIMRARPRSICHVVYSIPDYEACYDFMISRLNFRLSDRQRELGMYIRCDGTNDHHNFFILNANATFPGIDGKLRCHHVNFTVTDLDEIMAGKNYMERRGWPKSGMGLGRHRVASALFLYIPSPAGGEVEYGADADALDENWVPRDFDLMFGLAHWIHEIPEFWREGANWDVTFAAETAPYLGMVQPHDAADGGHR